MKHPVQYVAIVAALAVLPQASAAQDSAAAKASPCRESTCQILFDWGGSSPASYGQDRRYGPASDLEVFIPQFLRDLGLKLSASSGTTTMTIRPRIRNAMCDQMAGTGTDYNCKTAGEVAVQFATTEPDVKAPNAVRVTNRCSSGEVFMNIKDFSKFAADVIVYSLADEKTRGRRPASKC